MEKIKIEIDLSNKEMLFRLASIGFLELLSYPKILKEKDLRGQTVLYYFCKNINIFNNNDQKLIINYVLNLKDIEEHNDIMKDSLLHVLAARCREEIISHPLFYTLKNNHNQTPYYYLIRYAPLSKIKDFVNVEELLKPLADIKYVGPMMALDAFLDRSKKPSLKQLIDMKIPITVDNKNNLRRKVSYEDISKLKKNNPLLYIFS
jgi:hypothetical protein